MEERQGDLAIGRVALSSRGWVVRTADGRDLHVTVDGGRIEVDGRSYQVDARRLDDGVWSLLVEGGDAVEVRVGREGSGWVAHHPGGRLEGEVLDAGRAALFGPQTGRAGGGAVKTSMPGRIVDVLVSEGDEVSAGDGLVVVEAMKMENVLMAEGAGTVRTIHVSAGDAVDAGAVLLVLE